MENSTKIDLLKNEYFKLQDIYEDFDKRTHTIKNWSFISSIGAISIGFQSNKPVLFLIGSIIALVLWYLEGQWKMFQYSYAERIKELESAFRSDNFTEIVPLQIYSSWFPAYNKQKKKMFKIMFQSFVFLPHLITALAGIILYLITLI